MKIMAALLTVIVLVGPNRVTGAPPAASEDKPKPQDEYKALQYKSMPYRLLIPEGYERSKHYPLVLFFHGYGERGTDNAKQLKHDVRLFVEPDIRRKHPCFVLVPQAPSGWLGVTIPCEKPIPAPKNIPPAIALAIEILDAVEKEYSVDKRRVYLSGASNGACAVWLLLEHNSKRWAAAVPVSGAGDPGAIGAAHSVPIWDFHGDKDRTILVERSREMIAALKTAGGDPKYTEYAGVGHISAIDKAYTEPELLSWMFSQKRK
jgi:predicted peptidase